LREVVSVRQGSNAVASVTYNVVLQTNKGPHALTRATSNVGVEHMQQLVQEINAFLGTRSSAGGIAGAISGAMQQMVMTQQLVAQQMMAQQMAMSQMAMQQHQGYAAQGGYQPPQMYQPVGQAPYGGAAPFGAIPQQQFGAGGYGKL